MGREDVAACCRSPSEGIAQRVTRPPTGSIVYNETTKVYALRYTVSAPYRLDWRKRWYETLGSEDEGWTMQRAERALQDRLTEIRLGHWHPPQPVVEQVVEDPILTVFARKWLTDHNVGVEPRTIEFRDWAVEGHLLPLLGSYRVSELSSKLIDRYALTKQREGALSARSINATVKILAQLLADAVEDEAIPLEVNPAAGKKRRLRAGRPRRTWLALDEVRGLLDAAGNHRAMIALLLLAGTRISEACSLRWGAVDLTRGKLKIVESKTQAGERTIEIAPLLLTELKLLKARAESSEPTDFVFQTRNGTAMSRSNVTRSILKPAVERANKKRLKAGLLPLVGVTNHSLRRTFCSLLYAAGRSPDFVMHQMGHTSATLALEVYSKVMARNPDDEPLDDLVADLHRRIGTELALTRK
jgi:integrase